MKLQMTYEECTGTSKAFGSPECPLDYHDFISEFQSYITINGWDDHYKFIIYQYFAHLHTNYRRILTSDLATHLLVTGNPDTLYDIGSDDWFQAWELIYKWFLVQMRTTIRGSQEFELSDLTRQYEQFQFKDDETVLENHSRFMAIIKDILNCDPNSNISAAIRLRKFKQILPTELRTATFFADHNPQYQINPLVDNIATQEDKYTQYLKLLTDTQNHLFSTPQKIIQQRVNNIQQPTEHNTNINNPGYINKPCRFHLTPRGCIKGDDCAYRHINDLPSWMKQNQHQWCNLPEDYRKSLIDTYNETKKNKNTQKTNNIHVNHLTTAETNALTAFDTTSFQQDLDLVTSTPTTTSHDSSLVQSLTTENEQLRNQLQTYAAQQEILIHKFESLNSKLETIATPTYPALPAAEPVEPPKRKVLDLTRPRDRSNE